MIDRIKGINQLQFGFTLSQNGHSIILQKISRDKLMQSLTTTSELQEIIYVKVQFRRLQAYLHKQDKFVINIYLYNSTLRFSNLVEFNLDLTIVLDSYIVLINIINLRMFLGDPLSIETHLNNDWSLLLRNLKSKEDFLFELLQYNHKIITQVREQNTELFVNDQILQHHKQLSKITAGVEALESEQTEIYQKYEGTSVHQQRAIKLMSRVGVRIFEIYHNSIEKCKCYDESLNQKYIKIKKLFVQLLNQDNLNLDLIIKCLTKYSKEKISNEIGKLKRLIAALQNGQYTKLKEIYAPNERKVVRSSQKKIDVLRDLSKAKAEKEAAKTQQKQQQKIKKQKHKLMNALYSTMELSKQQFNDDENTPPQVRLEKLYNEILSRNRYNSEQIIEFHSKRDLFQQKVIFFNQMIQKQSKKITQVFVRKPIKRQRPIYPPLEVEKHQITIETHLGSTMNQTQCNIENIMTEGNIDNIKIQKKLMNTQNFKLKSISTKKQINDLPNIFNSFLATNQNFSNFKFDNSNRDIFTRSGRNIFPDIGKITSLDHKTQITKIKIDKILRTTVKNDDKVHEGTQRKHQSSRKTAVISREDVKTVEQSHKIRLNIRNIDLSANAQGTFKRVLAEKQRLKVDSIYDDHGLQVKKAELKYFQHKLNVMI